MSQALIVHDPYRNIDTTLAEFAKAEGVPKYTASHYYWWHKSLEGFRERPAKGTGNGIRPHTYTRNGVFIHCTEALRAVGMATNTIHALMDKYGTNDIDEIRRRRDAERAQAVARFETDDGRLLTVAEYAKEQGTTKNAVLLWARRKGSFKGFTGRGRSRLNPTLYPHSGLGMEKSATEWARYFKCGLDSVKSWLHHHDCTMTGFEKRKRHRSYKRSATYNGEKLSLAEIAQKIGVPYVRLYHYYIQHGDIDGFDPKRKQGRPRKRSA